MPRSVRMSLASVLLASSLLLPWRIVGKAADQTTAAAEQRAHLRRPIALALVDDGKTLLVACRDGNITIVDTNKLAVAAEHRVGGRLSDMAVDRESGRIVVTEEQRGELVLLARRATALQATGRIKVGPSPVSVQVGTGKATVADLWARRLFLVDLAARPESGPAVAATLDLPFAPRRQLLVPGTSSLLVADAFGGKLAVVDLASKKVASLRDLSGHNVRGLALGQRGKSLWLVQQRLNAYGHTTAGEIQNSNVLINHVRKLALGAILDPLADASRHDQLYMVGDIERGAGDPVAIAEIHDGQVLVALAGTNEVMIGRPEKVIWSRLPVGRRPTALAVDSKRRLAYVANTFSDSISVIDLAGPRVRAEVSLGAVPVKLSPEERGELLFHDARLSHRAWFSCQSCHPDGHSNGRLNDNFSDGSFGTPKRVLSLLGVKDTGPWAWNGAMPDLETQVRSSLTTTMRGPKPEPQQVSDLAAFLRTLPPPPSVARARGVVDEAAVKRGRKTFAREKCATCHVPPMYTSPKTFDVGLKDETGAAHFNPPSLRGLSQAGPYFHDNRALTLEEVFTRFRHQLSGPLANEELADLVQFLESL